MAMWAHAPPCDLGSDVGPSCGRECADWHTSRRRTGFGSDPGAESDERPSDQGPQIAGRARCLKPRHGRRIFALDLLGSMDHKDEIGMLHGDDFLTRLTAARSGSGIDGETVVSAPARFVRIRLGIVV